MTRSAISAMYVGVKRALTLTMSPKVIRAHNASMMRQTPTPVERYQNSGWGTSLRFFFGGNSTRFGCSRSGESTPMCASRGESLQSPFPSH
ncbi:hypothetical protein QR680_016660 [Steinernema hermaphroditum]|uniref:Uncharacterized protein n=1 Tax=Steinernema hermaphroditum TaxID=289476 RepID=A0AA39HBW2_9BILA|nr:hypothetical protein QR680_016660 [Steinernema hermaphroditum]